eukprot:SAG31_NODE_2077_length_6501_cov_2.482037_1_plen_105_part_00
MPAQGQSSTAVGSDAQTMAAELQAKTDLVRAFEKTLQSIVQERDQLVHEAARSAQELRQLKQVPLHGLQPPLSIGRVKSAPSVAMRAGSQQQGERFGRSSAYAD